MPTPTEIQTCINNLTSSSEVTEMVILAAETNAVTQNRAISVANTNSLPDLFTTQIAVGTVFFVQSLQIPVVAGVGSWLTMDNRVFRLDYPAADAWSWGNNTCGILGDNTTVSKSSPVSVVGGFCDWCWISAGDSHSLAVRQNGIAWAWGYNGQGRLGDNTTVNKSSPVSVVGGFTNWCQVSAGCLHSLGVRQNGTAWAWGGNNAGQLGDNTTVSKSSPVSVVLGFTNWCQVSAGRCHSLGVRQDGTARAWGDNTFGQLGTNSGYSVSRSSPTLIVGGFTDWCQVSAGRNHSLGVRQAGTVWAWGSNSFGQLGDDTTVNKSSPVQVVGGFTDWCQVSAGRYHSLGVRTGGTAWGWGSNGQGRLGDNTTVSKSSPVSVVGGFTDWCQLSAGRDHSLGVRQAGTAWGWGINTCGLLGDNTAVSRSSPVSVVGGFTDWCQVSAGLCHSLGLRRY
jgi:alpha-tubulin suppressor-like RCC1 family protein